jgi:hypothetical protein
MFFAPTVVIKSFALEPSPTEKTSELQEKHRILQDLLIII